MPVTRISLLFLAAATVLSVPAHAFECKVCHSKNPKMVAMHKALEGRNCFVCHRVGEKLMGKTQPKDIDSLLKRRVTEAECLACHGRQE